MATYYKKVRGIEPSMTEFIQIRDRKSIFHKIAVALIVLLIGVLFYILNYYTPLFADDYSYSFSFSTGDRIESISQIIESQVAHYYSMNGRSITHTLAQAFLLAGDNAFNVINTVFYIILLFLIYFHACGSFKNFSITKFSIGAMLLFLSCPAFGQSFLWITGAANYLYGIFIILCVLLPYRRMANSHTVTHSLFFEVIAAITYFALGVIAGWTNENTSVAMIVIMIGYMVLFYIKSIRIRIWNVAGCAGGIVGCVLMLSSPGTASRLVRSGGSGGIISWLKRIVFYSCDMLSNLHLAILMFAVLFILSVYQRQKQGAVPPPNTKNVLDIFKEYGITSVYLLGFLASVYSMIASPQFPGRAWSGPVVLFAISTVSLAPLVDVSKSKEVLGQRIIIGIIAILCALCASTYFNAFFDLKNVDAAYNNRIEEIENAVLSNKEAAEIPCIYGYTGYSCYDNIGDLNADSDKWPNTAIAKYYGIDEIVRKE